MRKKGFTLAEILITLGIIGVVAALTAPSLIKNTAGAKVGPTLAKVVGTMENANQQLMFDQGVTDLGAIYGSSNNAASTYLRDLSEYIRKAGYDSTRRTTIYNYNSTHNTNDYFNTLVGEFILPEGASIYPGTIYNDDYDPNDRSYQTHKSRFLEIYVDIDGSKSGNNMLADDVFKFMIDRKGSLVPWGSTASRNAFDSPIWTNDCNASSVRTPTTCAGSIFENNLKVIYQ